MDTDALTFFKSWEQGENKLTDDQAARLARLTAQWADQNTQNTTLLSIRSWTSIPETFWGFSRLPSEDDFILHCLTIEHTTGPRRIALLSMVHEIIEKEIWRLQVSIQHQPTKFVTAAINHILDRGKLDPNHKDRLTYLYRCGTKWAFFKEKGILLTTFVSPTENFERPRINLVEVDALNAYYNYVYSIELQQELEAAFRSLQAACISGWTKVDKPQIPSKSTRRRRRKLLKANNPNGLQLSGEQSGQYQSNHTFSPSHPLDRDAPPAINLDNNIRADFRTCLSTTPGSLHQAQVMGASPEDVATQDMDALAEEVATKDMDALAEEAATKDMDAIIDGVLREMSTQAL